MRHSPIADKLVDLPYWEANQRRQLRLFLIYRLVLALALFATFFSGLGPSQLGASDPWLYGVATTGYVIVTLLSLAFSLFNWRSVWAEYLFAVVVDGITVAALIYSSGGVRSGLGILLGISIAFASQGMPTAIALLGTALATLSILVETYLEGVTGTQGSPSYFSSLVLGASYFMLAFLSLELATRARSNENLLKQQGRDINNLTELNEHVLQRMETGVVILDENRRIKMLNDSAWGFLGRPVAAIGHPLKQVFPPLEQALDEWQRHPTSQRQHLHTHLEGNDLMVGFQPLGEAGGGGTLIFIDDASRATEQAQQLKLASLGRLAASIAHEIRNPLGAIGHANQLLRESPHLQGSDRRMTEIIDRNTQRLNQVIENVLALSRRHEPKPEVVPLHPWLRRLAGEFEENLSLPAGRLQVQVQPLESRLRFDPLQIQQVLTILVENAVKHQQRPDLTIVLAGGVDERSRAGYLQVMDDGQRIPDAIIDRIFDPFFTTQNSGTGLGLYLAKELCDANDIRLSYLPIPTGGNCFKLRFRPDMVV